MCARDEKPRSITFAVQRLRQEMGMGIQHCDRNCQKIWDCPVLRNAPEPEHVFDLKKEAPFQYVSCFRRHQKKASPSVGDDDPSRLYTPEG